MKRDNDSPAYSFAYASHCCPFGVGAVEGPSEKAVVEYFAAANFANELDFVGPAFAADSVVVAVVAAEAAALELAVVVGPRQQQQQRQRLYSSPFSFVSLDFLHVPAQLGQRCSATDRPRTVCPLLTPL